MAISALELVKYTVVLSILCLCCFLISFCLFLNHTQGTEIYERSNPAQYNRAISFMSAVISIVTVATLATQHVLRVSLTLPAERLHNSDLTAATFAVNVDRLTFVTREK